MSQSAIQPRFPWSVYWITLVCIGLFTLWPIGSLLLASTIADANGCQVDEGSVHVCMVLGQDWGKTLGAMTVMGWFMLLTLPLGIGAGIVWLITLLIHNAAWVRKARTPT